MPFAPKDLLALQPRLHKYCTSLAGPYDADDLCQHSLMKALENANQFTENTNLKRWVFKIAFRKHISNFRHKEPLYVDDAILTGITEKHLGPDYSTPHTILEVNQTISAIASLTPKRQKALLAITLGDHFKEHAKQIGVTEKTVKKYVTDARRELRKLTDEFGTASNTASLSQKFSGDKNSLLANIWPSYFNQDLGFI